SSARLPELDRLDARRAHIQTHYRLRSHSKHVPASFCEVRLRSSGSLHRCLDLLLAPRFHLHRLLFHPLIQLRFLEAPAVTQLEGRNLLLVHVLVQRVRTHSQILRSLANVHHFSRVGHNVSPLPQNPALSPAFSFRQPLRKLGERSPRSRCVECIFVC